MRTKTIYGRATILTGNDRPDFAKLKKLATVGGMFGDVYTDGKYVYGANGYEVYRHTVKQFEQATKSKIHTTEVVFRKFNKKNGGQIIALFPYILDNGHYNQSYMHVGQHSGADYDHCVTISSPATEAEYSDLKKELEGIGYILKVLEKRSRSKWLNARREQIALPGGIPFGKLNY